VWLWVTLVQGEKEEKTYIFESFLIVNIFISLNGNIFILLRSKWKDYFESAKIRIFKKIND